MGFCRKMKSFALLLAFVASAHSVELTPDTFDDEVVSSGKNAFVKFQAPWWGHCKRMKPDFDKLAAEYKDSKTVVVADVDCTVHQSLCSEHGVRGYPTIKYYQGGEAEDYKGGRSYKDIKKFIDDNLMEPACDSNNKDSCSPEQLELLAEAEALSPADRKAKVDSIKADIKATEKKVADLKKSMKWLKAVKEADKKDEL